MADDSVLQMKLARDEGFRGRCQYEIVKVARVVKDEVDTTPGHVLRDALAATALGNPALVAESMSVGIVGAPNLTTATTTVNPDGSVTTDCTDAALFAQISTLWDYYAGVV